MQLDISEIIEVPDITRWVKIDLRFKFTEYLDNETKIENFITMVVWDYGTEYEFNSRVCTVLDVGEHGPTLNSWSRDNWKPRLTFDNWLYRYIVGPI